MKKIICPLLFTFILSCVYPSNRVSGTISETDTGCIIKGKVNFKNGKSVINAQVRLHDYNIRPKTHEKAPVLKRSGDTQTDTNGIYRFDSVDTGKFFVEINDHDSLGALVAAPVLPTDTLVEANAVLRCFGILVGRVDTTTNAEITTTVIVLPEINRTVAVDSLGNFIAVKLPEWDYQLRVESNGTPISLPSDSVRVPVIAGDTTFVSKVGAQTGRIIINGTVIETP